MYFPYLRGKQFELIALRELSALMSANRQKVSPIIEPVKDSSTYKKTLLELATNNINFNIVINPTVGDLVKSTNSILKSLENELLDYENYQLAIIINEKTNNEVIFNLIDECDVNANGISLIHNTALDSVSVIVEQYSNLLPVVNNIINFNKTSRRYYRAFNPSTIIGLDDYFNSMEKNADYLSIADSPFSEEHLFYKQDGFKGFSDFLTIGDNYSEGGFLPYAVAIHISYVDTDKKIRVKHFVSDSNDDASDIAGKFSEALDKLIKWVNKEKVKSLAIKEFKELHTTGHFPGLGTIKKLSIMHHLEIVLKQI